LIAKRVIAAWEWLVGNPATTNLQGRIFHTVCLVILVVLALNIPFDYYIGLPGLSLLMFFLFLIAAAIYYFSRVRGRQTEGIIAYQVTTLASLIANYFWNSGIDGPTALIFLFSLVMTVAICQGRQVWVWISLNTIAFLSLLLLQYNRPELVENSYRSLDERYLDFSYTYLAVGSLIVFIMLSVRRAYQRERHAAQTRTEELHQSNQTKNKLLSILAHDLKEPLTSILGYLELLNEYQLDETERADMQNQLLSRTQSASQMLGNVLSWIKTQMEGIEVRLKPLSPARELAATVQLVKGLASEKGIETRVTMEEQICIMADADMLQLIVRNLLTNAVKFTYPGGHISLDVRHQEEQCVISVADSGMGIPDEQQQDLFRLSGQSSYGTSKEKGAGLGLVLCKNFVELQKGSISFTSAAGAGTTFFVKFPVCGSFDEQPVVREMELVKR
jgi:two-component system, sensor histidine kinase and response regulator